MHTLHFAISADAGDSANIGAEFDRLISILRQLGYDFDDGRSAGLSQAQPAILWNDTLRGIALGLAEQNGAFLVSVAAFTTDECSQIVQVIADRMPIIPLEHAAAALSWQQGASTAGGARL